MEITTIIKRFTEENLLFSDDWNWTALSGGTMSQVHLLQQKNGDYFVVKQNKEPIIRAEVEFLLAYRHINLLPKLVSVDSGHRYMIYTYIPGSTDNSNSRKKEFLQALVSSLINHYNPVSSPGQWGSQQELVNSWEQFLTGEVAAAQKVLAPYQKQTGLMLEAPIPLKQNQNQPQLVPYLIHGDCGIHNFIFCNKTLGAVIDPTPIIGLPHYDVIYAFFSSPQDLKRETLDTVFSEMAATLPDKSQLYNEVQIGLYQRMGICLKHHPTDLPAYLEAWEYWKETITQENFTS